MEREETQIAIEEYWAPRYLRNPNACEGGGVWTTAMLGVAGSASIHPVVTVTQNYGDSTDSSPNQSQVSRNSSRKSNSSLLVHSGERAKHSLSVPRFASPFWLRLCTGAKL